MTESHSPAANDPSWVVVGTAQDVQTPPWPVVEVDGQSFVLVRDGQTLHAVSSVCPHLQAPLTAAEVTTDRIACTRHWYEYCLSDGANVHPGGSSDGLAVRPVRVVDGAIEVQITGSPARATSLQP